MSEENEIPIRKNYVKIEADEFLYNVIPRLIEMGVEEAQVFEKNEYLGVLSLRELGRKGRVQSETKVEKVVKRLKPVLNTHPYHEIGNKLLTNKIHSIIIEDEQSNAILGIVHGLDLVEKFMPNQDDPAMNYAQQDVQVIREIYSLATAIKIIRTHNISRLPVVDENNKLIGTISSVKIFSVLFRPPDHENVVDPEGLIIDPYSDIVSDFMDDPLPVLPESATLKEVVKEMKAKETDAVLLGSPRKIKGIITLTDLLETISVPEAKAGYYVQVVGEELDDVDVDQIISETSNFLKKFAEAIGDNGRVVVHVKSFPKNKFRNHILFQVRFRVYTNKGFLFIARGEGFGLMAAINEAIERLTREVLAKKEAWKKYINRSIVADFLYEI